jgi:hypothetical protein
VTQNPYDGAPPIADALAALGHAAGDDLALMTAALLDRIALDPTTSDEDLPIVADCADHAARGLAAREGHPEVAHPLQYVRGRYTQR